LVIALVSIQFASLGNEVFSTSDIYLNPLSNRNVCTSCWTDMVLQIVTPKQMIAKCRRHILMLYSKSRNNLKSSWFEGFYSTTVSFYSPPSPSQISDVHNIVRKIMLLILNYYQVRQGCTWSRNYKSPSSSSSSSDRFRIFRLC
jgi:hypothetical protein